MLRGDCATTGKSDGPEIVQISAEDLAFLYQVSSDE